MIQLVRGADGLTIRLLSDMTEQYAASRDSYHPKLTSIAADFGLDTLFATNAGDLLGRGFLARLKRYDAQVTAISKHQQRRGVKPRQAQRYRKAVQRMRGFVKTEINRTINRIIELHRPAALVLEQLDFRHPDLSRRMNRMLRNCGRRVLQDKLTDLEARFDIKTVEVNPAYTSQRCSSCGFVARSNRPSRSRCRCGWCGHQAHADVNGACNIQARRSWPTDRRKRFDKRAALGELARQFTERFAQASVRRGDVLLKSTFMRENLLSVDQTAFALRLSQ